MDACFVFYSLEPHLELCVWQSSERLIFASHLLRVSLAGMYITRPSLKVGRYKMIKHKLDKGNDVNPKRYCKQTEILYVMFFIFVYRYNVEVTLTALSLFSLRFNMLAKTRQTWKMDGMNTVEYEIISREYFPLYTNITVNIGTEAGLHPPPPAKKLADIPAAEVQSNDPAKPPAKQKEDQSEK